MYLLFVLLSMFSLIFLLIYLIRLIGVTVSVEAKIFEILEDFVEVKYRYFRIRNFYPVIKVDFVINGKQVKAGIGNKDSRMYRIIEDDTLNIEQAKNYYPWRKLQVGDVIKVRVSKKDNTRIVVDEWVTKTYRSETVMFLALSILFLIGGLALIPLMF